MQSVSTWKNTLVNTGDEITAIDTRDGKTYTVAKLADGNVWMTQNLDHDIVSTPNYYTSSNTDLPTNTTWTGTATRATSDTTWSDSKTTPESYDPGIKYWTGIMPGDQVTCEAIGGGWFTRLGVCFFDASHVSSSTGDSHYHLGNYYNWTAAVAMSDSSSYTTETDVNQSICPAGWRLPTKTGNKSFESLITEAGLTSGPDGNVQNSPTYFMYGNMWPNFGGIGTDGEYWSSVVSSSDDSYAFAFDGPMDNLEPTTTVMYRDHGFSVRCVAR